LHQPEESLLHNVFGRPDIAKHPKCQVNQVRTIRRPRLTDLIIRRHEM
jgi:hypothetical protein